MYDKMLRDQWAALRAYLSSVDLAQSSAAPSALNGWTVRELVVHLGVGLVTLDEVQAAPAGTTPIPIAEYIAAYRPAAHAIATATRRVSENLDDVLPGVDSMAERAFSALDRGLPAVVRGPRGPLRSDDFVLTRLIELVVHADDLHRSTHLGQGPAVPPQAAETVATALADAYQQRTSFPPETAETWRWIRLASGRLHSPNPHLPLL